MHAGIWLVAADVDVFRVFGAAKLCHNILWKVNEHRAGAACTGDVKSFFDNAGKILAVSHGNTVFCDASGDADNIDLLESIVSDEVTGYLSGKANERDTVVICRCKSCHEVGCSGAAGYKTDTYFTGGSGIGIGSMHQSLLMAGQNYGNIILFIKLIADINGAGSGIAEDIFHALFPERLYQ